MCLCLRILLGWLVNWLCIWIACLHRCLRAAACLLVTFVLWHCVTCVSSKQGAFWWHLFFDICSLASRVWAANKERWASKQTRSVEQASKLGALSKQANKERWAANKERWASISLQQNFHAFSKLYLSQTLTPLFQTKEPWLFGWHL